MNQAGQESIECSSCSISAMWVTDRANRWRRCTGGHNKSRTWLTELELFISRARCCDCVGRLLSTVSIKPVKSRQDLWSSHVNHRTLCHRSIEEYSYQNLCMIRLTSLGIFVTFMSTLACLCMCFYCFYNLLLLLCYYKHLTYIQCVSEKNDTALACYNFHVHQPILI